MEEIKVVEEDTEMGGIFAAAVICTTGCTALCTGTAGLGTFVGAGVAEAGGFATPIP